MKFWIGITDKGWYEFLSLRVADEVNFWQPGGGQAFRALDSGEPFLFKLHSPDNYIVGGGFFVKHSILPMSLAWEAFKEKNGASDFDTFRGMITKFRQRRGTEELDPAIGCIILTSPFFFDRPVWIPSPENWAASIVQGKAYSTTDPIGAELWSKVEERLNLAAVRPALNLEGASLTAEIEGRYGREFLTRARLGQGAFRVLVTEAYNRRCAITGERTLPVLESAHIKPFVQLGPNQTCNGILLRSDLHTLFDLGYLTVTESFSIEISKRIKEKYENGRDYYALHGSKLKQLPANWVDRPSREFLGWHNNNVFAS